MRRRKDGGDHSQWTPDAAKSRVKLGKLGEKITKRFLVEMGVVCCQRIETGFRILHTPHGVMPIPVAKVAGDFHGFVLQKSPDGFAPWPIPILCEAKWRSSEKFSWAALEDQQHEYLAEYAKHRCMAWVSWANERGVVLFKYKQAILNGWADGKPMTWETANLIAIRKQTGLD